MKKIHFTCGPSQLYPTIKKHLRSAWEEDIGSLSHRSQKFREIYQTTQNNLRELLSIPSDHRIFFLSSALEAMERIIENTVEKNSYHFVNGAFSQKFYEFAKILKRHPQSYNVEEGQGYETEKADIPKKTELICITHNETSTGVAIPFRSINQLHRSFSKASRSSRVPLIAVDIVSSAPCISLDFNNIDLAFFSVQKGFGLPAGLGILIVSPRAIERSLQLEKKGQIVGSYRAFSSLLQKDKIFQTPETPNVWSIFLLNKVTDDMLKKGISKIHKEKELKAKLIYNFFAEHPKYKPEVKNTSFRSETTINIRVGKDRNKLLKKLENRGLIVSSGYGKFKETHIRIANFPTHSLRQIQKLLSTIGYN